jgi:hypothetical protein
MPLLVGLLLLVIIVVLLRWYSEADVKQLKSSLQWTGILLGLIAVALLAATGRFGAALAFLMGLVAWAWRVFHVVQMLRTMAGHLGAQRKQQSAASSAPVMDEAEALRVLGLEPGATEEDIKAAHRRLMAQMHPDVGGSGYLAGKINAARDLLLRKRR